jgi:cell division septum initiation protein DivIVA
MPDQSSAATEHAILAEITRPLEALPEDPLAYVDADFPTALRGYDRVAVDEYVRQTRRLVAELQATRSPEAAVRRALERVGEQISGILQRAHETAEQITAQSRSEAEDRLAQARLEALQITSAAEQQVRDLDADTDRIWMERQRIVADAEDLAGQLQALAKNAGERFPADAETTAATVAFDPAAEEEPAGYAEADEADFGAEGELGAADEGGHDEDEPEDAAPIGDETDLGGEAALEAEAGDDEGDVTDEGDVGDEPAAPDHRSEVERTVAFQPLASEEDRTEGDHAGQRSTDDDDTAVIPPASQAANRRANK